MEENKNKASKKKVINISNSFLQAKKSNSISTNGFRVLSIALANAKEEYMDGGSTFQGKLYKAKIKPSELKHYFGTNSTYSSKYIKDGLKNLKENWIKDPFTDKYYPMFAEIDSKNKTLVFNPLIFNEKKIDLAQINNFSRIILPRLSEEFVKEKRLSKNAFALELLLQSFKDEYKVNLWRLKELLGLVKSDDKTGELLDYQYKDFRNFHRNLKRWIKEINEIPEEQKIIMDLKHEILKTPEGYAESVIFTYWKTQSIKLLEGDVEPTTEEQKESNVDDMLDRFIDSDLKQDE